MNKTFFANPEKAQIIPIVVIGVLVMVMLAAVLVDGGSLLSNRRSAQAAADAGALAGAKFLCTGNTAENRTLAINAAQNYVNTNEAILDGEPTFSTVSISGHPVAGITVKTMLTNNSFFAGIFGDDSLLARAQATAGCYHPSTTVHLIPLAFYYESPPVNAGDADCDADGSCNLVNYDFTDLMEELQATNPKDQPLDDIYVIMNEVKICEKDTVGNIVCTNMKQNASGGNRAWLNFSEIADVNNLKKVFRDGIESPLILPSWLNGDPGVITTMYNDSLYEELPLITGYEGLPYRMGLVPVFDNYCTSGNPEADCPAVWDDGDSVVYISNVNQQSYRLVGLAPFVITCVTKNYTAAFGQSIPKKDLPAGLPGGMKNKPQCPGSLAAGYTDNNAIEGYFVTGTPLDDFATGTGGVSAGLDIVSLTK